MGSSLGTQERNILLFVTFLTDVGADLMFYYGFWYNLV